jgi:hypothetical protein
MPATLVLPVFMRIGSRGTEERVGYVRVDLDTGGLTTDLDEAEAKLPDMLDRSPELADVQRGAKEARDDASAHG